MDFYEDYKLGNSKTWKTESGLNIVIESVDHDNKILHGYSVFALPSGPHAFPCHWDSEGIVNNLPTNFGLSLKKVT